MAEQIKIQAGDNETARLVAHAILGTVIAELQGNSALSGGAGGVVGEVAADIIRKQLYGKEVKDLTEEEKETISALSQLATGVVILAMLAQQLVAVKMRLRITRRDYGMVVILSVYHQKQERIMIQ
ncbi:VENN motif pre-toxin domain-containing protein [Gilliamella sp. W8126]|nr:VENN motif pre-toxin domain-containing protein [Gilliamella sp. W8126]